MSLKKLFQGGAIYLFLVSAAHFFQIKVPVLFIYFDVPSTVYQDRIIAALAFMAAVFLMGCVKVCDYFTQMIRYALIAGWGLVAILAANNFLAEDHLRMNPVYWLGILFVAVYVGLLQIVYQKCRIK